MIFEKYVEGGILFVYASVDAVDDPHSGMDTAKGFLLPEEVKDDSLREEYYQWVRDLGSALRALGCVNSGIPEDGIPKQPNW